MPEATLPPTVDRPTEDDARDVGPTHLRAWHESYVSEGHGIDAAWIDTHLAFVTDPGSTEFRREVFHRQEADPTQVLYRTVHLAGEVVGFLHAEAVADAVTLEGLYLLDPLKGTGLADHLMTVFDTWSAGRPAGLDVITFNERAVRFYARHGFSESGERSVWNDVVPVTRMVRGGATSR